MDTDLTHIQHGLQQRIRRDILAELHAAGGLPQGRITLEFLYLMPHEFIDAYVGLFWRALHEEKPTAAESTEGETKNVPKQKAGIALGSENRLQAQGGKRYKNYWTVKDEKALRRKSRVDAKLRELAHSITRPLDQGDPPPCGGCGKYMQSGWRFCPACGNNLSTNR